MIEYSIIIPCYNSEEYLESCFKSLLNISYEIDSFEVLFVDDCSSDQTVEKINGFITNNKINAKLLKNLVNSGPGASRRYAAENASGEYLLFCDSDDWYDADILKDVDKEISKCGSDLVIFDMSYVLGDKYVRKNYTSSYHYGDKLSYLANCCESLCNLAVRKSLFLSIPQIDIRNGEDLALVPLLIANANIISHIDKSYYNYVMRSDSASLRKPTKNAYNNMLLAYGHISKHLNTDSQEVLDCMEYIGIKTILYNSTLMAIKGGNDKNTLSKIVGDFKQLYPDWINNSYLRKLPAYKRFYLKSTHNP